MNGCNPCEWLWSVWVVRLAKWLLDVNTWSHDFLVSILEVMTSWCQYLKSWLLDINTWSHDFSISILEVMTSRYQYLKSWLLYVKTWCHDFSISILEVMTSRCQYLKSWLLDVNNWSYYNLQGQVRCTFGCSDLFLMSDKWQICLPSSDLRDEGGIMRDATIRSLYLLTSPQDSWLSNAGLLAKQALLRYSYNQRSIWWTK